MSRSLRKCAGFFHPVGVQFSEAALSSHRLRAGSWSFGACQSCMHPLELIILMFKVLGSSKGIYGTSDHFKWPDGRDILAPLLPQDRDAG